MVGGTAPAPGIMWLAEKDLRVYVAAINVLLFNALGSVPGPLVVGLLTPDDQKAPTREVLRGDSNHPHFAVNTKQRKLCIPLTTMYLTDNPKHQNVGDGRYVLLVDLGSFVLVVGGFFCQKMASRDKYRSRGTL